MARTPLFGGRALRGLAVVPLVLILTLFLLTRRDSAYISRLRWPNPEQSAVSFWEQVFEVLDRVRPQADPVHLTASAPSENWAPGTTSARVNLTQLNDEDEAALRASHAAFVTELTALQALLPFGAGSTGVVTSAGAHNFGQAVTMVVMLRQTGSVLPVHIVLDSKTHAVDEMCRGHLARLHAKCVFIHDTWDQMPRRGPPHLRGFQWKIISILASSFQRVLFLDADTLPVLNPDAIFAPEAEPLTSAGLITWPDFWILTSSYLFYRIAGDIEMPSLAERPSSDSGVMVVDKARHADTMLLALYYNFYGPEYYYPLLCQAGPGAGDKESFLHAALVLEGLSAGRKKEESKHLAEWRETEARSAFWDVNRLPHVHGRSLEIKWKGMFMQQMDPVEDFRVVTSMRGGAGKGKQRPTEDMYGNRYMFFHHNGMKLDFTQLVNEGNPILDRDANGNFVRLWGAPDWIIERTGRDVEKEVWKTLTKLYCDTSLRDVCVKLVNYTLDVF